MQGLAKYLDGPYSSVQIDFQSEIWHRHSGIPSESGWYYITTTTPMEVHSQQALWQRTYITKKQVEATVKNYDIQTRACRYGADLSALWSTEAVYSGLASSLQARAREHTFADPGTGGLALSKYPELHRYEWVFNFVTLARLMPQCSCEDMILHLGEQVWRAKHGWPLLCAE